MATGVVLGLIGAGLSLASFFMTSMLPLRFLALGSSAFFLACGIIEEQLPSIILNCLLLPLNTIRLLEIRKLVRDIESVSQDAPIADWLLPHMTRRKAAAGSCLFHLGDPADEMFYLHSGTIELRELGKELGVGALFGEIGIFSPKSKRTQSIYCKTDCELFVMSRKAVIMLYYKNPKLGFYLVGLIVERLIQDPPTSGSADGNPIAPQPAS